MYFLESVSPSLKDNKAERLGYSKKDYSKKRGDPKITPSKNELY